MEEPGNQDDNKVDSAESERSHAGSIPGVVDDGGVSENDGDEDDAEDDDDDEESGDGDEVEGEDWETDDEDGDDGSEGDDDEDDEEDHMLEASDSDIEEGERCPICLNRFREQDVGTPESCDHIFCLECIQEWAKNMNTCPSDRQVFRLILCRHCGEDRIYKKIPVDDRKAQEEEEEEEEPTYCEVCRQCDREDRLLLCDGCDLGYHLECLTPPLSDIPLDEWFCPECATRHVTEEQENEEEEEEVVPHGASHRPRRQIPRTLAFERVRSAIEEIRVRRTRSIRRIVSSSEEEEEEMCTSASAAPSASPVAKSSPKKRPVKRKKTPRKYSKKKASKKTTKKKTKRKTKRKTKGKKGRKKKKRSGRTARPSSTVKTRIAGALGLSNPPTGRTIPLQKSKPDKTLDMKKSDIGAAQLSIFGNREELIHFDDEYGAPSTSETPSTSATRVTKYSRLALSSYKPIGRVPTMPVMREKTKQIVIKTTPASSSCDLLGSIMQDQSKLHLDSKHVTIKRDGSLSAKPKDITKKVDVKRGEVRNKSEAAEVTSLFRSSFTAVDKTESSSSVLSSLSAAKETGVPGDGAVDEEYDPAHPTDEMEFNSGKTVKDHTAQEQDSHEDEYDPAHPTDADCDEDDNDDVYSGDDSNGVALETQTDNHEEMESEEGGDEMKDVENDIVDSNLSKCNDDSGNNSKNDEDCSTKEKHVDSISSGSEKSGIFDISDSKDTGKKLSEGKKELASNVNKCENIFDTTNKESSTYQQNIKTKSSKSESSCKDKKQGDSITQVVSNEKSAAKVDVSPSKDKTLNDNKDVNVKKISPSVKITESSKKVSLKPFEISKKTLVEKRRLYGGEIDFTEDVGFSEGGFPENFEVKIKRIEEVFKDTKKPDEAVLKDSKKPDEAEKEHKSQDKEKTIFPITKQVDQKKKGFKSDDLMKLSGKFKPISGKIESTEKEKVTVSERFKMISDDAKDIEIITIDDEEDPIHEMRKLDKELDLELENPDVGKRKEMDKSSRNERDRDQKKSKRKVSIEGGEFDKGKYRRELKDSRKNDPDNRKQNWEEIEEGEVEDEHRYREKKKKEKKKRSKIDKYYDDENVEKNSDDTRIVIQVSQNTENRTVWEEDEKLKKKRDKEERRRDKDKKERKHRRHRSRSRSYERRDRSRSRERRRSRSRSRDRSRRKRRDRSKSRSRDRSLERSHKKKKKERERSREREKSRSRERDRSREWSRDKSREREKNKSREKSLEKVDIFGRSQRRDILKEKENVILPQPKISAFKSHHLDDRLAEIFPAKRQKMEEVSPVSNTKAAKNAHLRPSKIETVSNIAVKEGNHRTYNEMEEKDDEFDDEPEETEQFQYTDRDEYLSQNKHKQQHTNLITIGVNGSDYDPANPTESSSPAPPPLPELVAAQTPPLPPVGDFTQFPPPPPGPPPPGPPPPGMILQDHPPVPIQVSGPPGQAILGDGPPILIQGPPPPLERPPPGMIQHRPNITLPMNLNVLPPGFHQGLPQSLPPPQRQLITVSPFRPGMPPRMHRLPSPGGPRFGGWQVTPTTEVIPSQFDSRVQSPARLPGPPLINGPFDGLPPPQTDGPPPPHNLPPGHPQFEQLQHVIPIQTDGPPPNVVQIPIDVEDPGLGQPPRQMPPPGHESQIVHLGPHPHDPQPRLPIPLLPTTEPPPISVMVSLPPPNSSLMSVPPPTLINMPNSMNNAFPRTGTPPVSISPILGHPRITTPPSSMTAIPGLDMVEISTMATDGAARSVSSSNPEETLSQLEEISKLLNTQAKLMLASKDKKTDSSKLADGLVSSSNDADVFKVPLPPGGKSVGSKTDTVEMTEVVDMDMASPIDEEGNIELPVSPQFDNLIDNTDDWLEEVFNKKSTKINEKDSERKSDINNKDSSGAKEKEKEKNLTPTKSKDKDHDKSKEKESPRKSREDRSKRSSKENKPHHHHGHHTRKHKQKLDNDKDSKDLKLKALKDAHLDIDTQEMPSSAVEMTNKEKYLKKLHLQERVVEEVKMAIKPHYSAKRIDKDQYKEILRKAVPKICHSKSGDINPNKIKSLVEAYIEKFNKPGKQLINEEHEKQISPGVKANGERAKPKPAR